MIDLYEAEICFKTLLEGPFHEKIFEVGQLHICLLPLKISSNFAFFGRFSPPLWIGQKLVTSTFLGAKSFPKGMQSVCKHFTLLVRAFLAQISNIWQKKWKSFKFSNSGIFLEFFWKIWKFWKICSFSTTYRNHMRPKYVLRPY